ncbi:DJ-1/PfpI family protein [Solibacillus daqui]|uniref:DJ-1/PfpI family protein n=1 Tax=Solibacillus daqui TaxID=2912187 RepID=UPI00236738F2|nr:DJ-1/PfpI family protein [Solibacillus daqui]
MKKTAVLIYPNFSEYELTTALSILMQGAKPVSIISIDKEPVKGEAGLTLMADQTIDQINYEEFDSLLLTGCMDVFAIIDNTKYIDFIKKISNQDNFIIASISSSPALLAKAGLLKNNNYTVGLLEEARNNSGLFEGANYVNELLVKDGNIITAWGSAFIKFGILFGKSLDLQFEEGWYGK